MSNPIVTIQDQFIAAFDAVDGTGNYENNLAEVYQEMQTEVPSCPAIAVIFAVPQKAKIMDSAGTAFDFDMNFWIEGYIKSNTDTGNLGTLRKDQYSLFGDIYRLIYSISKTYITSSPAWNIRFDVPLEMTPIFPINPMEKNTVAFGIGGQIHCRNLNVTLT